VIIVSDASPLIRLFDGGEIAALQEIYDAVVIPHSVYGEVFERGRARTKPRWIRIASLDDPECLALWDRIRGDLGPGEAEAIPLARQLKATILIDDQQARAYCDIHGIPCLSLHAALKAGLSAKRFQAVLDGVRRETGELICEPDF
jgi:predicted nucleic acid-binding protein